MDNAVSPATLHAGRRSSAYVIGLSCVAAIGGFLFGFDSGVINGAVNALAKAFGTQAAGTGFAVASVLLGCAVGAFVAGTLANWIGRRPTMLLNAILFLVTAVATGVANTAAFSSQRARQPVLPSAAPAYWRRCTLQKSLRRRCGAAWPRCSTWPLLLGIQRISQQRDSHQSCLRS